MVAAGVASALVATLSALVTPSALAVVGTIPVVIGVAVAVVGVVVAVAGVVVAGVPPAILATTIVVVIAAVLSAILAFTIVVVIAVVLPAILATTIVVVVTVVVVLPPVLAIWPPVWSETVSLVMLSTICWACVYSDLGVPAGAVAGRSCPSLSVLLAPLAISLRSLYQSLLSSCQQLSTSGFCPCPLL